MGKLNVPKMANFMEIDVYVLVACPENTLINSQVNCDGDVDNNDDDDDNGDGNE